MTESEIRADERRRCVTRAFDFLHKCREGNIRDWSDANLEYAILDDASPISFPVFDLARRMANALRETRDGGPSFDTALDLCMEWDMLDAEHDMDEWHRIHGYAKEASE
jgi:hypothetical protein